MYSDYDGDDDEIVVTLLPRLVLCHSGVVGKSKGAITNNWSKL
jgi:hypothetical protein